MSTNIKGDSPSDLKWLVDRRNLIQTLLLDLYSSNFANEADKLRRATLELLVGVSFALWRSVFLVYRRGGRNEVPQCAHEFLKGLIADNTVLYIHEARASTWTSGYYLNDAYLRLRLILELRRDNGSPSRAKEYIFIDTYFTTLIRDQGVDSCLTELWDRAFSAARLPFEEANFIGSLPTAT